MSEIALIPISKDTVRIFIILMEVVFVRILVCLKSEIVFFEELVHDFIFLVLLLSHQLVKFIALFLALVLT